MKPARRIPVLVVFGWLGASAAVQARPPSPPGPKVVVFHPVLDPAVRRALECFQRGNYHAAASLYEQILADAPDNVLALTNLGVVRFRLDQLDGAAEVLERAAMLAPDDAFTRYTLGIVYYRQKHDERAEEALRRAAELEPRNPRNASLHHFLLLVYARMGRADRVRAEWGKIYEIELSTPYP